MQLNERLGLTEHYRYRTCDLLLCFVPHTNIVWLCRCPWLLLSWETSVCKMPPRTLSWSGSPLVIIPSDPLSPAPCSEQRERWLRISEFIRRRLSSLVLDVAVSSTSSSSWDDATWDWLVRGRELFHLFAKTNGIITPICYIKAGPNSTCSKTTVIDTNLTND